MKGPGFRYDLDIRRVWECPACKKQLRYLGDVTSRRCSCEAEGHWMQLVQERFRTTFPEREKIVIPEEYPEEATTEEATTEEPAATESPEPTIAETNSTTELTTIPETKTATETFEPPTEIEVAPTETVEDIPSADDSPELPAQESTSEENPDRKKRRKKRRRKKSRNKPPEGSEKQESPQNSPAPQPNADSEQSKSDVNPQSSSEGDDFGTDVF